MCLAIPGKVIEIVDEEKQIAKVEVSGVRRNVNIGLLTGDERPAFGDYVLIHVGFALSKIDEQEAMETLRMIGIDAVRIADVGVAGIHRLLDKRPLLDACGGLIVVAGMEGALPSVIGGLSSRPVVAVPTSVGYGVHLGGLTPLFAMLTNHPFGALLTPSPQPAASTLAPSDPSPPGFPSPCG